MPQRQAHRQGDPAGGDDLQVFRNTRTGGGSPPAARGRATKTERERQTRILARRRRNCFGEHDVPYENPVLCMTIYRISWMISSTTSGRTLRSSRTSWMNFRKTQQDVAKRH